MICSMVTMDNKTFSIHRAADFQLQHWWKSNSTVAAGGSHRLAVADADEFAQRGAEHELGDGGQFNRHKPNVFPINAANGSAFFRLVYP